MAAAMLGGAFEIDQAGDAVAVGESIANTAVAMLGESTLEVPCDSHVEGAGPAAEDVNTRHLQSRARPKTSLSRGA